MYPWIDGKKHAKAMWKEVNSDDGRLINETFEDDFSSEILFWRSVSPLF